MDRWKGLYEAREPLVIWKKVSVGQCMTRGREICVPREGDLLLYVRSDKDMRLSLNVGGYVWGVFDVKAGEAMALLGGVPVPLICLRFHDVRLAVEGGAKEMEGEMALEFGYVCLSTESRRNLAMHAWWMPVADVNDNHHYVVASGMAVKREGKEPRGEACALLHQCMCDAPLDLIFFPTMWQGLNCSVIEGFMGVEDCAAVRLELPRERPSLVFMKEEVVGVLDGAIRGRLPGWKRVGDKVTAGVYGVGAGMHWHQEGALQGGTMGLLVCVEEPEEGGETVFGSDEGERKILVPREGRAIVFGLQVPHMAEAVVRGRKGILACEIAMEQKNI